MRPKEFWKATAPITQVGKTATNFPSCFQAKGTATLDLPEKITLNPLKIKTNSVSRASRTEFGEDAKPVEIGPCRKQIK